MVKMTFLVSPIVTNMNSRPFSLGGYPEFSSKMVKDECLCAITGNSISLKSNRCRHHNFSGNVSTDFSQIGGSRIRERRIKKANPSFTKS